MIRAIVPHMRERGSGTILNVTSSVVFNPMPFSVAYTASKAAVESLSEALYHEPAPFGIHVKMMEPGYGRGTNFETAAVALNGENSIPAPYQAQLGVLMNGLPEVATNVEDVADAVFRAVNDTSRTLRYSVAAPEKRAELSKEAFLAMSRQAFGEPQH
ncbi:MAG: short-chain dehydrogenase/reductase [Rhizobium sp.]|nr:short-chain dehydrogenase/reductase [Rhizobium sp.]